MNYFKKLNYNDVMNLVEGVVSEVYVAGDVKIVCAGKSSLLLSYGSEQTMLIEDAYLFDCLDAAIIINERVVQHFSASQPLVDCGEYYMSTHPTMNKQHVASYHALTLDETIKIYNELILKPRDVQLFVSHSSSLLSNTYPVYFK